MNVGISVPLPAYNVDVALMARKAEELGFESFWSPNATPCSLPKRSPPSRQNRRWRQGWSASPQPSYGRHRVLSAEA